MRKKHIKEFVTNYLKENIASNDVVVDATIGNGHDTLFLAKIAKFVYGFDIQEEAIINTKNLLAANNLSNYKLILDSHENILDYVENFKAVVFNLGYLPNSDKSITTTKNTTINTLKKITPKLKNNQFIIITVYPHHEEGKIEAPAVVEFSSNLDNSYHVLQYQLINSFINPPFVIVIEKS